MIPEQYSLIQSSRNALFQYCDTVSPQHLILAHPTWSTKSMYDLLVHIAKAYNFWIGGFGLKKQSPPLGGGLGTMQEIRNLYVEVDRLMLEFINTYDHSWEQIIKGQAGQNRIEINVSALTLFTHVITHEFHHKGQILTTGRLHGYMPVDTDIIRF